MEKYLDKLQPAMKFQILKGQLRNPIWPFTFITRKHIVFYTLVTFHSLRIGEISRVRIFKLLVIRDNLIQFLLLAVKSANVNNDAFTVLQTVVCSNLEVSNTVQLSVGTGLGLNKHIIDIYYIWFMHICGFEVLPSFHSMI